MSNAESTSDAADNEPLRARAEHQLNETTSSPSDLPADNLVQLVHELQVHQIELELQGEELRRAQLVLQAAVERYTDLFDFAPVGYLTVDPRGEILQANLMAATLLAVDRPKLRGQFLGQLIAPVDLPAYYKLRRRLVVPDLMEQIDLQMLRAGQPPLRTRVHIVTRYDEARTGLLWHVALNDITEQKRTELILRQLNDELEQRTEQLKYTNKELLAEIDRRTRAEAALRRREQSLEKENAQLIEQTKRLASVEERQRLARELHDSVAQTFYSIALSSHMSKMQTERAPALLQRDLDRIASLAEVGLIEMKALILDLHYTALHTDGLVRVLERQVAAIQARKDIEVEADLGQEPAVSLSAKEAAYGIVREALQNALRHSGARHLTLKLAQTPDALHLEIRDDGVGFDPSAVGKGTLGLRSMTERARSVRGRVKIESEPSRGTCVRAQIPVEPV